MHHNILTKQTEFDKVTEYDIMHQNKLTKLTESDIKKEEEEKEKK